MGTAVRQLHSEVGTTQRPGIAVQAHASDSCSNPATIRCLMPLRQRWSHGATFVGNESVDRRAVDLLDGDL
jgi:hypothetical protein